MKLALPLLALCLMSGCVTRPVPVNPDARIAKENADLIEERKGFIEYLDLLQQDLFHLRQREEYLTQELLKVDARRVF